MRLYITILVLMTSVPSLVAQDMDLKGVVRDYIRAGRVTDKKLVSGPRMRSGGDSPFQKIGLSFSTGTMGLIDIGLVTPINEKFKLRAGIGYMPSLMSVNKKLEVNDYYLKNRIDGNYTPVYDVDLSPEFINGRFLADFYPTEEIPFHITAGFYLGVNKFKAEGRLINPDTGENTVLSPQWNNQWPWLNIEGYAMDIKDGVLDAEIIMGSIIKPYIGVGYGYVVPETKWALNVDIGMTYQGDFKINQFGKKAPKYTRPDDWHSPEEHTSSAIDIKKYTNAAYIKFWPTLSVQVSYRIY